MKKDYQYTVHKNLSSFRIYEHMSINKEKKLATSHVGIVAS